VAHLLGHLGEIYISIAKNIRFGQGEDIVQELEDLELSPELEAWFRHDQALEALPATVIEWYEQSATELAAVFEAVEPDEPTWTWWPPDQTVGFWMRRMAHETAVHRWDAQLAHNLNRIIRRPDDPVHAEPIARELAQDGIDEALTVYQPQWCRPQSQVPGRGEAFRFQQADGPAAWVVRFEGQGMEASPELSAADVTIRGDASALLLFLWHRIPADELEILGDRSLVDRYFELVPPD
jgi:uncharacterized protein (TIGR03083 family)